VVVSYFVGAPHSPCLQISFSLSRGEGRSSAEVRIGATRVTAEVTASIAAPYPERPLEGYLSFNVSITPLASRSVDVGSFKPPPAAVSIGRMLERALREARAVDTEALCIVPGKAVWAIRTDVHVLNDDGNAMDASMFATVAALLHFRRAEVSTDDAGAPVVHGYREREPVPLGIHHVPVCVTYALFNAQRIKAAVVAAAAVAMGTSVVSAASAVAASSASGSGRGGSSNDDEDQEVLVMDPSKAEEDTADGSLTFIVNAHKELCGISKLGGCAIAARTLTAAARVATDLAVGLVALLKRAVAEAEVAEQEREKARHAAASGSAAQVAAVDVTSGAALEGVRRSGTGSKFTVEADDDDEDDNGAAEAEDDEAIDIDAHEDAGTAAAAALLSGSGTHKRFGRSIAATVNSTVAGQRRAGSNGRPSKRSIAAAEAEAAVDELDFSASAAHRPVG
jgi:exosome complex component RRP45